jgi:hypothetical protein
MSEPNAPKLLDDHIGQHLRESEASGELRSAPSFGRPLQFNEVMTTRQPSCVWR